MRYNMHSENADYWKDKYLDLLEKYNALLTEKMERKSYNSSGASLQNRALNIITQMPFKTIERL